MTDLRTAAQQALEALESLQGGCTDSNDGTVEAITVWCPEIIEALRAALDEPVQDTGVKLKPVFYAPRRLDDEEIEAIVGKPVHEPPCATRECMPSECPNCVSLQDQNTELDRKLADLEQTSLELCEVCGWRTLIPGDCCLNCERKHPLGQASTDVPLTVYSVKKAEPVERKPMNEFDALRLVTETVGLLQSAGPVEGLIGIIRAVERAHGIK
jgi:hypothetical protein